MIVFLDSVEKAVLLLVWGRVLSVLLGAAEHDIDTAQWRVVLAVVTLGGLIRFFKKYPFTNIAGSRIERNENLRVRDLPVF